MFGKVKTEMNFDRNESLRNDASETHDYNDEKTMISGNKLENLFRRAGEGSVASKRVELITNQGSTNRIDKYKRKWKQAHSTEESAT